MNKQSDNVENSTEIEKLTKLVQAYAPHDGSFELPISGVRIFRGSRIDPHPISIVSQAGVCIVAQGAKRIILGDRIYEYDRSRMVVYSMALPVEARVVQASRSEPYLCLVLDITPQKISELALKVFPHGLPKVQDTGGIHVGHSDEHIIAAAVRLIEAMKNQKERKLLSDLIIDEIFIRLLFSPLGPAVAQIGSIESNTWKIVKAISWLRENYAETLNIEALAKLVNMSETSFHRHFKSVTMMSPGQFQKVLRLQEAKNLMLTEMLDVTSASQRVGYASPSQFSREYSRFFGSSPIKDIAKTRQSTDA